MLTSDPDSPFLPRYRWLLPPELPPESAEALADLPPAVRSALARRGILEAEAATAFLARSTGDTNPFAMAGMQAAVSRIRVAIQSGEKIAVYGDFDADGVTATAVLTQTLESLGADVRTFIPDRERDGYGVHQFALEALLADGVGLVITVDCGIRAGDEVAALRLKGLDVIVTDHHVLPEELPEAVAVLNPRRPDCRYGYTGLAGVGLAFKLAQALLRVEAQSPSPRRNGMPAGPALAEADLLDLVALGTVADVVPLTGENRSLVARGLVALRASRRPGIRALMAVAGLKPEHLHAHEIGFVLAPRLNAAGRMGDAKRALALLLTQDEAEARALATELHGLNDARRGATESAFGAAEAALSDRLNGSFLLHADPGMALGVLGLVAGRLAERYYRPAAAVRVDGELARGSARSIPEFNIVDAMDGMADLFVRHGGHAKAAGFTLRTADLPELERRMGDAAAQALDGVDLRRTLEIDAVLAAEDVHWKLYESLAALEPYGEGNPRPLLLLRNAHIIGARKVGTGHLRFTIATPAGTLEAIAFGQSARFDRPDFRMSQLLCADVVGSLRLDSWNGQTRLELKVEDLVAV